MLQNNYKTWHYLKKIKHEKYDIINKNKIRYDLNREITRVSDLLSTEIRKSKYLTGKESKPTNAESILPQNRFEVSSFRNFWNTNKNHLKWGKRTNQHFIISKIN